MKKYYETYVISAFPGCGKSYCFKKYQDKFTILDSDSSEFSWIKDRNGNNTKERNANFPQNYITHIKNNIGKVDIIFVSSHETVRKALVENNIRFTLVYPHKSCKTEWIERFKNRGNDSKFIDFISNNWNKFIDDMDNDRYIEKKIKLNSNEYINCDLLKKLINHI